jgi:type I restriction enzyme S subunit
MKKEWPTVRLGEVLRPVTREESVDALKEYRLLGVRLDGRGPFLRETVSWTQTSATKLYRVAEGDFIYSRLFACRGAFGVIDHDLSDCHVSGEFPTSAPVPGRLDVSFLSYWFRRSCGVEWHCSARARPRRSDEGIERILALRRRGDQLRRRWKEAGRACHER